MDTRLTADERQIAIDRLTSSRDLLLCAVRGVSDTQAAFTPERGRWTILQPVEHLAIGDPGLLRRIQRGLSQPAQPELPTGQYPDLSQAIADFKKNRAITIEFARQTNDELRSHFVPHTLLGPWTATSG